jgi:dolichol-phosphate mannosyltransferase
MNERELVSTAFNPAISVIVPTLNEAGNMEQLMQRIHQPLQDANIKHEILVVDDHSTDDTIKMAHNAPSDYCVRVVTKHGRPGKAYSLLEGFDAASHDIVAMIDADLQYPPEAIKPMYDRLRDEQADLVVTERVDQETPFLRQISTRIFNLIFARLLFGVKYDTQSGLKLFRKSILRNYRLNPSPWSFDLEFIVRALENKDRIINHKIAFAERFAGEAKVNLISDTWELVVASLRLKRDSTLKRFNFTLKSLFRVSKRSIAVLAGFLCLLFALNGVHQAPADGLSLGQVIQYVSKGGNQKKTNTPTLPTTPIVTKPVTATPAAANTTAPTTATTTSTPVATTPATATTTTAPNTTATTTKKATVTIPKATQATATGAQSTNYYGTSPLSASKRSLLQRVTHTSLIVGAVLLLLATLAQIGRLAWRRLKRPTATARAIEVRSL